MQKLHRLSDYLTYHNDLIDAKLQLIKQLAASGFFEPIAIRILIDIAFSFDNFPLDRFKQILRGAHVVITNDSGNYWNKWSAWARKDGSYGERWSSHPSIAPPNVYQLPYIGTQPAQFEIKMGRKNSEYFNLLCGVYFWKPDLNPEHTGEMADPKDDYAHNWAYYASQIPLVGSAANKYKYYDPTSSNPGDNVVGKPCTWFQFEKISADFSDPTVVAKIEGKVGHVEGYFEYKRTGFNIGPFGTSYYTENPWNPMYITCCDGVCTTQVFKINGVRHTVPYVHDTICGLNRDVIDKLYGHGEILYKRDLWDSVMENYFCNEIAKTYTTLNGTKTINRRCVGHVRTDVDNDLQGQSPRIASLKDKLTRRGLNKQFIEKMRKSEIENEPEDENEDEKFDIGGW